MHQNNIAENSCTIRIDFHGIERFDNPFHWRNRQHVIHYLPTVHLHSMHSTASAAVLSLVLVSMGHRCGHSTTASNAFASLHRYRQNGWPARQHCWHFALPFLDSIRDLDCCWPHWSLRCDSWRICTNKWGNYSNNIRNDTDTKRKQKWSTP